MLNSIPNLHVVENGQEFPLYWYEENKNKRRSLFDSMGGDDDYIRHDGVTNWILQQTRTRYHAKNITKEHIFYYVYGLLHSKDYRERFAADLKKSLPRIPLVDKVEDFMNFYKAGRKLADLHLNYETVEPYKDAVVTGEKPLEGNDSDYEYYKIPDKMRFKSKQDKSTIYYNGHIVVSNIPEKLMSTLLMVSLRLSGLWSVTVYLLTRQVRLRTTATIGLWSIRSHGTS